MMTTLLTALAAISFPGGNVSDLAKSVAEATNQNVVFEAGAAEAAPAFEYESANLNELARTIQAGSGFKRAPGAEHVFHHGRLGSWNFGTPSVQGTLNDGQWKSGSAWPADSLKEGKVTIHTPSGRSYSIDSLPKEFLPKPLEVHWYFQGLALKPWVTDLPAQDFVGYIAKAVGGKLIQKTDKFILDLDGGEVQRRALATLNAVQKSKSFANVNAREKGRIELSRSVLSGLSPTQMAALLIAPQSNLRFEIGPATRPAVQTYVQTLLQSDMNPDQIEEQQLFAQEQQGRRGQRPNRQPNIARMLSRADPRVLGYTTIDAKFNVRVELLTLDNFGRPGRLITLP